MIPMRAGTREVMVGKIKRRKVPSAVQKVAQLQRHLPKGDSRSLRELSLDEVKVLDSVRVSRPTTTRKANRSTPDGSPLPERLAKSQGSFVVGDDQQGHRTYTFRENPLERLYDRLQEMTGNRTELAALGNEYTALVKYRTHWHCAALQSSVGTADLNRAFASDPSSMSGMAKTERQAHHRQQYREAGKFLYDRLGITEGHRAVIILDNVVCYGNELGVAGHAIGYVSPYRARKAALDTLRDCAGRLAGLWGIG